jgi:Ferritin-like
MTAPDTVKLLPRNVAALRRGQNPLATPRVTAGNPVSTRLESGIGNCFPGLECDLRNLERRFFPCLEVDIEDQAITIVGVDMAAAAAAVSAGQLSHRATAALRVIESQLKSGPAWTIDQVSGVFGHYGKLNVRIATLNAPTDGHNRRPPDAWTAIRMLPERSAVTIHCRRIGQKPVRVTGLRSSYLDHHGALAAAFQPGELTQSLCSPWTHDFRDCGCFYWASNHPDIAKPPIQQSVPETPDWNRPVPWERADRTPGKLPPRSTAADSSDVELDHYEINHRWQELNFVLAGRETVGPYVPNVLTAQPLSTRADLIKALRYAAGVEMAVLHEYLAAAFSFQNPDKLRGALRDSVIAAKAEILRIAVGEMHHLRVVNDVLKLLAGQGPFQPALQVATLLPPAGTHKPRPVSIRAADRPTIDRFIDVERPSTSVDGLYSRILATLNRLGTEPQRQAIRTVMAEGEDHFETFQFIKEWLKPHQPAEYLRAMDMKLGTRASKAHVKLQDKYRELLRQLYRGYSQGFPDGGEDIKKARGSMVSRFGIEDLAEAVSEEKLLVSFDWIEDDPRFGWVDPP